MSTKTKESFRLRDIKVSARDQLMLDPKTIAIEKGFNARNYHLPENRQHLDELKCSIKLNGVLVPLLVRCDGESRQAVLVDGECRLRAALELIEEGHEIIAVPTVQVQGNNEADRLMTCLTANTGKPLSKWEIGSAFKRLMAFGWDEAKIAEKMGQSERFVKESLEMSDAPEEVKQMLSQEAVTPSLALKHLRSNGAGAVGSLKTEVAKARAKAKPGKTKVTAKRERKVKGIKLLPDEFSQVLKALKKAATSEKGFEELCKDAIEMLSAASNRGK